MCVGVDSLHHSLTPKQAVTDSYACMQKYSDPYSPPYVVQAVTDFRARVQKYEAVYETLTDRSQHWIKLINMVTGRGHMDVNRVSGERRGRVSSAWGRERRRWGNANIRAVKGE